MTDYNKIFIAHYKTRLPLILWGSSGYGKSSLVAAFASRHKMTLKVLHAQYLDPLSLFIPSTQDMAEKGYAKYYPSDFIHEIIHAKGKTILFLDELTRAREDTLNILTELLLERKVFGYSLPPNVMIVAASNFAEEDTGVRELPDAVMQRLTHIVHSPEPDILAKNLQNELARKAMEQSRNIIAKPSSFAVLDRLRASPRQIDACGALAQAGLSEADLLTVCRGRVGIEAGAELSFALTRALSGGGVEFPLKLNDSTMLSLSLFEEKGAVIEVIEFLRSQSNYVDAQAHVASYLLFHARPETCRAMQASRFQFSFVAAPISSEGKELFSSEHGDAGLPLKAGKPWQWYAAKIGKISSR